MAVASCSGLRGSPAPIQIVANRQRETVLEIEIQDVLVARKGGVGMRSCVGVHLQRIEGSFGSMLP